MKKKVKTKMLNELGRKIGATLIVASMIAGIAVPTVQTIPQASTVKKTKTVKLKGVSIITGSSKTITVKSSSKVKWATSKKSVATVKSAGKSKAKVTAKKTGTATVTGKAGSKKWTVKVKVKKKTSGSKKFSFWVEYAPKTIKYYYPGFAANYIGYGSQGNGETDPEGSDVAMIIAGSSSNKSKITCASSDTSVLKVASFTKSDTYKDGSLNKSFKLVPYKAGTATVTLKYPGGSYKTKVTVKPSKVYKKAGNFITAVRNSGLDDEHKVYVLAAWLNKDTLYGTPKHDKIYGLMVEKKGVCDDYAETYEWLAKLVGLDCHMVSNSYHAFNQVKINGKWYNFDATGSHEKEEPYTYANSCALFSDMESKKQSNSDLYNGHGLIGHVPATSTYYDFGNADSVNYWQGSQEKQEKWFKYWTAFENTEQYKKLIAL